MLFHLSYVLGVRVTKGRDTAVEQVKEDSNTVIIIIIIGPVFIENSPVNIDGEEPPLFVCVRMCVCGDT